MWATRGRKLLRYADDGRREEMADIGWLGGAVEINALHEDRGGDRWLATRGAGLLRFRAGQFVRVPTSHQSVQAVFEGLDSNLWEGTMGGLNRLRPHTVQHYYDLLRLRILELAVEEARPFTGEIEVDESYFGPRRVRGKRGRGFLRSLS
jgi:ligand-binding sensor domain-containing protein